MGRGRLLLRAGGEVMSGGSAGCAEFPAGGERAGGEVAGEEPGDITAVMVRGKARTDDGGRKTEDGGRRARSAQSMGLPRKGQGRPMWGLRCACAPVWFRAALEERCGTPSNAGAHPLADCLLRAPLLAARQSRHRGKGTRGGGEGRREGGSSRALDSTLSDCCRQPKRRSRLVVVPEKAASGLRSDNSSPGQENGDDGKGSYPHVSSGACVRRVGGCARRVRVRVR